MSKIILIFHGLDTNKFTMVHIFKWLRTWPFIHLLFVPENMKDFKLGTWMSCTNVVPGTRGVGTCSIIRWTLSTWSHFVIVYPLFEGKFNFGRYYFLFKQLDRTSGTWYCAVNYWWWTRWGSKSLIVTLQSF